MTLTATCATIAAMIASASGGETITIAPGSDCTQVTVRKSFTTPVTIDAEGTTIRGLVVTGGGLRWRAGTITAPGGAYVRGPMGYGVLLRGAYNVRFDGVTFTNASRGMVINDSKRVIVADSRFTQLGQDGIITSGSQALLITGNRFLDTRARPTQCALPTETVAGLSRRDCIARAGTWKDGGHPDAIQMRNGVTDALIENNSIEGTTQGIAQMDTKGDAPLQRVRVERNTIVTDNPHKITLTACQDCSIRQNVLKRPSGSRWKAVINPGAALHCGNVAADAKTREPKC